MEKIEVTITKEDYKKAVDFYFGENCPLTRAVERVTGSEKVLVRYTEVVIDQDVYDISGFTEHLKDTKDYVGKSEFAKKINNYILDARLDKDVPEYHVILTKNASNE